MSFFKEQVRSFARRAQGAAIGHFSFPSGRARGGNGDGRSVFHARIGYRMSACRRGLSSDLARASAVARPLGSRGLLDLPPRPRSRVAHHDVRLGHRHASRIAIAPGCFDQHASCFSIAGLGDPAAADTLAARLLGRDQPEIGHELARRRETTEIADRGNKITAEIRSSPRSARNALTTGAIDQFASIAVMCASSWSRRSWAAHTASM